MLFAHCRSGWRLSIYCREGNFVEICSYIVAVVAVVLAYYGSHILHTAVAYFDVVLVEKGVVLVLLREVFSYELEEGFADVGFHAAVKRRIIPDNVTLAVSNCGY